MTWIFMTIMGGCLTITSLVITVWVRRVAGRERIVKKQEDRITGEWENIKKKRSEIEAIRDECQAESRRVDMLCRKLQSIKIKNKAVDDLWYRIEAQKGNDNIILPFWLSKAIYECFRENEKFLPEEQGEGK